MSEESDQLEARALVVQNAADEIAAILTERMADANSDPVLATPSAMIGTLLAAAFRSSQATLFPWAPADYVALVRAHADDVERLHCPK